MVKFLSGGQQFDGSTVPVCAFWRNDFTTDVDKEFSSLTGNGQEYAQKGKGKDSAIGSFEGQCVANAFFPKSEITCFNEGTCNGEGKCLPCSKYRYGGMKMAITHSPPTDILRSFNKGFTEEQSEAPQTAYPASTSTSIQQDQLPYHILLRNIQAEIAKCCHWNAGDGEPGRFFLASIGDFGGLTPLTITDANGDDLNLKGIIVKNDAFPDEVGTFFPAGTTVVAGFEDQPSFYLEPRTGAIKDGEGVIFNLNSGSSSGDSPFTESPFSIRVKALSSDTNLLITDAVRASELACVEATNQLNTQTGFFNNAANTNDSATIAAATTKYNLAVSNQSTSCTAKNSAQTQGTNAIALIASTISAESRGDIVTNGVALADKLDELIASVELSGSVVGSTTAADQTAAQSRFLKIQSRLIRQSAIGGDTKCEFFFDDNNIAVNWNTPVDGSLLCNGVRTDCAFYTGEAWQFATQEKMEIGRPVVAEQLQEVRFRSEDWSRFTNPEEEFIERFTTPFIWAFKDYVAVSSEPDIEDLVLYRPKVLFGRGTSLSQYETPRADRIKISNYETFEISKSASRLVPGSDTLDKQISTDYPTFVSKPSVPTAIRLSITHPPATGDPFIYRMWSPEKNKITLFGKASPDQTIYLINSTALRERDRYHAKFGTKNFFSVPTVIPTSPSFNNLTSTVLLDTISPIRNEKEVNLGAEAPLGFDQVSSDREGFWQSIQEVDVVHDQINEIHAFLIVGETSILVNTVLVDCRFLHSIPVQTTFLGTDFSMLNLGTDNSSLGTNSGDTAKEGTLTAETRQIVGASKETLSLGYGYFAWRFKDRGLQFGTLNADNDLQGQTQIADLDSTLLITEAAPSAFIINLAYHTVQYQKDEVVIPSSDWYVINDCGFIMMSIADPNINRVLPLPNQQGNQQALTDILIDGGGTGSEIAQWGLLSVTLTTAQGDKSLIQFYRDADGFALPANYVVVGPPIRATSGSAFGRPNPDTDTLTVSYTYLRTQSTKQDPEGSFDDAEDEPVLSDTVVTSNYFSDNLRTHRHTVDFDTETGILTAGGATKDTRISQDQQEYVFVYSDSEGRPLGKKVTRMYVMYYNLSCINIEILYRWAADCTMYALIPDLSTVVGDAGGTLTRPLGATSDSNDDRLQLGNRIKNLLGDRDCEYKTNCGDHDFISFGPLRREFEVIVKVGEGEDSFQKANFPNAGQALEGEIVTSLPPGTQFQRKSGPMWYPYTACNRPRYQFNTNGPLFTDSTELINITTKDPGIVTFDGADAGTAVLSEGSATFEGQGGEFGGLPDQACEAFHGPDQVTPKILDIHPSLRACTSAYTYGNLIAKSGENRFAGYARKRGVIDMFLYTGLSWTEPVFGNLGRSRLVFELSDERGDFVGGFSGKTVGRRWMPMFPRRDNIGAGADLFGEIMEPQSYRTLCTSTPLSAITETISPAVEATNLLTLNALRFSHKGLIANKTLAAVEFPFSPYIPMFLPDLDVGKETTDPSRGETSEGATINPISTTWAWREQEKPVQRAVVGNSILQGIGFSTPDYFIDNRRLEVMLRPEEGQYNVEWTAPIYNVDGTVSTNAFLKLGTGPAREIVVDFVNRTLGPAAQAGTVYDTDLDIGDTPFPCAEGTPTDNPNLAPLCSCTIDITDSSLLDSPTSLPSRFLHLDELAPQGFAALYETTTLQTPFAIDIPRTQQEQPCCQCLYYIRGIFFSLNGGFLPSVTDLDPAFSSQVAFTYAWSRVPHGISKGVAVDGDFDSIENLAENLTVSNQGDIFSTRIPNTRNRLAPETDGGAFFPSPQLALSDSIIISAGLPAGSAKLHGGIPAVNKISRGQSEGIGLSMFFPSFVRLTKVEVTFYVGDGLAAPEYSVGLVSSDLRTNPGGFITDNAFRKVGSSTETAIGGDIPARNTLDDTDVADGRAKFTATVSPNYDGLPFWESYGQEWALKFDSRSSSTSMGIVSIQLTVDALISSSETTETIGVRERKYYRATGTIPNDLNPERFLGEMDSATGYWRSTEIGSFKGHNRHRAYAWGVEIQDNQEPIKGADIQALEKLQEDEYNSTRGLLASPYKYVFTGFTPLDEERWLSLLSESNPSWSLTLTNNVSSIEEVLNQANQDPLYGVVPNRQTFNAPGHVWVHNFEETYAPCCFGCVHSMIVNYDFLHLHDNLALVETAGFWSELPSGFTRLIRSTMLLPDPTFQGGAGSVGNVILLEESQFTDSQGDAISVDVLNQAGFTRDPETGQIYMDGATPGAGAGGPAGPDSSCGGSKGES